MSEKKVIPLEELGTLVQELKAQGKKIVHCHGNFDIVHYGHIRHFINAKEQGDILIVTITPDRFIQKGPDRPFFHEEIRLKQLAALECIDYVALNKWPTAVETIKILQPDVYAKGKEVLSNKEIDTLGKGISNLSAEEQTLTSLGGKLHLTDEITFSSSRIINQISSSITEETKQFLNNFKKKFTAEEILKILDSLKNLNVLVIGDSILDEYIFSETLEKTGKNALVAYKFLKSETYLGGVLAVVNHLANFVNKVSLVTCTGKDHYEYIKNNLNKKIEKNILTQDSETLIKRRYIDSYSNQKIFEIYNVEDFKISNENEQKIIQHLDQNLDKFDLIIVSDFGHGILSYNIRDYLYKCKKFLAINCQLNAGNMGYNFITKYKRADFVSLDEREIRLPFQDKKKEIHIPVIKLSNRLNIDKINVTLGKRGSIYYERGENYYTPSFTKEPVDTIGAGDAVLSLTSLLAYKNINPNIIPFLGNSIGALAVKIMGNKEPVSETELRKFISYILK